MLALALSGLYGGIGGKVFSMAIDMGRHPLVALSCGLFWPVALVAGGLRAWAAS